MLQKLQFVPWIIFNFSIEALEPTKLNTVRKNRGKSTPHAKPEVETSKPEPEPEVLVSQNQRLKSETEQQPKEGAVQRHLIKRPFAQIHG